MKDIATNVMAQEKSSGRKHNNKRMKSLVNVLMSGSLFTAPSLESSAMLSKKFSVAIALLDYGSAGFVGGFHTLHSK